MMGGGDRQGQFFDEFKLDEVVPRTIWFARSRRSSIWVGRTRSWRLTTRIRADRATPGDHPEKPRHQGRGLSKALRITDFVRFRQSETSTVRSNKVVWQVRHARAFYSELPNA